MKPHLPVKSSLNSLCVRFGRESNNNLKQTFFTSFSSCIYDFSSFKECLTDCCNISVITPLLQSDWQFAKKTHRYLNCLFRPGPSSAPCLFLHPMYPCTLSTLALYLPPAPYLPTATYLPTAPYILLHPIYSCTISTPATYLPTASYMLLHTIYP